MNVTISGSTLPSGFCALTNQQWQTLVALLSGTIDASEGFVNVGSNEPDPADRGYPWMRTLTDGSPDKVYYWWNGYWLARHALPPQSMIMVELAAADIDTFDGGEAGAVTTVSGPMWEEVTELAARSPMGAGTLPLSGKVLTVTTVGDGEQAGLDMITLTVNTMPAHTHQIAIATDNVGGPTAWNLMWESDGTATVNYTTDSIGGGNAHNNLHPVYTVRFIRRTDRLFYRV